MNKNTVYFICEVLDLSVPTFAKNVLSVPNEEFDLWKNDYSDLSPSLEKNVSKYFKDEFQMESPLLIFASPFLKMGFSVRDEFPDALELEPPGFADLGFLIEEEGFSLSDRRGTGAGITGLYQYEDWKSLVEILSQCLKCEAEDTNEFIRCWLKAIPDFSQKTLEEYEVYFKSVRESEDREEQMSKKEIQERNDFLELVELAKSGEATARYNVIIQLSRFRGVVADELGISWLKGLTKESGVIGKKAKYLVALNNATSWKYFSSPLSFLETVAKKIENPK